MELYRSGLLNDENGKLSNRNRAKLIESLGFGTWESSGDISQLHIKRAIKENLDLNTVLPLEVDDHQIHIEEHTKFILSDECAKFGTQHLQKLQDHIMAHRSMNYALNQLEQAQAEKYMRNE